VRQTCLIEFGATRPSANEMLHSSTSSYSSLCWVSPGGVG